MAGCMTNSIGRGGGGGGRLVTRRVTNGLGGQGALCRFFLGGLPCDTNGVTDPK